MSVQDNVINEIVAARAAAAVATEVDAQNTNNDWIAFILAYLGRASNGVYRNQREGQGYRENLIKAGGLIVSALVAYDRQQNRAATPGTVAAHHVQDDQYILDAKAAGSSLK